MFVQTDNAAGNQVVAYQRAADGALTAAGTYDTPENKKFTEAFLAEYKEIPDWTDGEMYQAMQILFAVV